MFLGLHVDEVVVLVDHFVTVLLSNLYEGYLIRRETLVPDNSLLLSIDVNHTFVGCGKGFHELGSLSLS